MGQAPCPLCKDGCCWGQNVSGGRGEGGLPEAGSGSGGKAQVGDIPDVPCRYD